jgi:hypothetical protein
VGPPEKEVGSPRQLGNERRCSIPRVGPIRF